MASDVPEDWFLEGRDASRTTGTSSHACLHSGKWGTGAVEECDVWAQGVAVARVKLVNNGRNLGAGH